MDVNRGTAVSVKGKEIGTTRLCVGVRSAGISPSEIAWSEAAYMNEMAV